MSDTRRRLEEFILANPGSHFNEISRELNLASGQVQHHCHILCTEANIVEESVYGRTHYFPADYDGWERRVIALLRRETTRDIVFELLDEGECRPHELTDRLGIARSTLEWHLDRLVEQDVVEKRRNARNHVTLELVQPKEVAELLEDVSPSLPERMVDRFERLVDSLFSE